MKYTLQDLQNMQIAGGVSLATAPDHTFKNWLRNSLTNAGFTANEVEVDYVVSQEERLRAVNRLQELGANLPRLQVLKSNENNTKSGRPSLSTEESS